MSHSHLRSHWIVGLLLPAITICGSPSGLWDRVEDWRRPGSQRASAKAGGLLLDNLFQSAQEKLLDATLRFPSRTLELRSGGRGTAAASQKPDSFTPIAAVSLPLSYPGSRASIFEPGRIMVWFRSGPVDTHPTSTPVDDSMYLR